MNELRKKIKDFTVYVAQMVAVKAEKQKQFTLKVNKQTQLKRDITELRDVSLLLEKCNIAARTVIKTEVEALITKALQSIFEDPTITFNIEFTSRRNQIEADFSLSFIHDSKKIEGDIMDTYGGGVVEVIATVLRFTLMELLKINGPIFLDEPGRMVSAQYDENFSKFLHAICKKFNRQVILITHNQKLAAYADKRIEVRLEKGISKTRN